MDILIAASAPQGNTISHKYIKSKNAILQLAQFFIISRYNFVFLYYNTIV